MSAPKLPEVCGATYGTGRPHPHGTATCARPAGHPEVSEDGIGHSPDPIPVQPSPRKRTATEAMRLRPAAKRPGAEPAVAAARAAGSVDALEQQLAELVAGLERLHAPLTLASGSLCRECLLPHPCRTLRLVHPGAEGGAPERKESP